VKKRKSDLKRYQEWCEEEGVDPQEATIDDIDSFLKWLNSDGYSDSSISSFYYSLKGYYDEIAGLDDSLFESNRLKHSEYLGDSSGSHQKRKEKSEQEDIKYITEEEKDKLKEHVPNPKIKNELLIELLWQTGIRVSEAALIERDDIDRQNREIDIYAPKTDDWRTVYYQPSLDILLDQYLNGGYRDRYTTAIDSSYLFVSRKAEKMKPGTLNRIVKKAAENAGIQEVTGTDKNGDRHRITAHAIRHGHAVYSLKQDIDISFIKEHLGHKDISTTQVYLDLVESDVREKYHSKF
jgi:integrase/recombinase XerD